MSRTFNGAVVGSVLFNNFSVPLSTSLTYGAWIFPTTWGAASGNGPGYVLADDAPNTGIEVFVSKSATGGGGSLTGRTSCAKTTSQAVSADSSLVLNQWQYLSYEMNASTLVSRLFINGVEVSYKTQTTGSGALTNQGTFSVGNASNTGTATGFTGSIDTVSFWQALLTTAQILAAMAYHGVSSVLPGNLLNYWPLLGTTSPEPNSVSGGTSLIVASGGAPQGPNSPGQTAPTGEGSFVSYIKTATFRKTKIKSVMHNHTTE